ncbi:MAG TPA: hypothetical protein VN258_02750 [Mobilitalea sp.]|nr:hypothetical protein [Mobilitalea sp.]
MDKSVYYFREQQYDKALGLLADSIDQIKFIIEAIIKDRDYFNLVATESMLEMMTGILEAKKNRDLVLLADLLELQLINFLIGVQELIISKEEILFNEDNYKENINLLLEAHVGFPGELKEPINTTKLLESGYRVEFTSCGQMTLAAENAGFTFYFHTNSKVQTEAFLIARHWYQKEKERYIVYGFGMGYHINELQSMAKNADLEIYEADLNVIQLACAFADVRELLLKPRIKIIYDPQLEQLKARITSLESNEKLVIHYPSYINIKNKNGKKLLRGYLPWSKAIEEC